MVFHFIYRLFSWLPEARVKKGKVEQCFIVHPSEREFVVFQFFLCARLDYPRNNKFSCCRK